jgi:hypothetical protein
LKYNPFYEIPIASQTLNPETDILVYHRVFGAKSTENLFLPGPYI